MSYVGSRRDQTLLYRGIDVVCGYATWGMKLGRVYCQPIVKGVSPIHLPGSSRYALILWRGAKCISTPLLYTVNGSCPKSAKVFIIGIEKQVDGSLP